MPAAEALSRQTWLGRMAVEILPVLQESLLRLCARFDPLLVFLGGSAVHGELCGIEDPLARRHPLSDLDVGILTRRTVEDGVRRQCRAEGTGLSHQGPDVRIGFYNLAQWPRQLPTLGMAETARCGIVLWGEPGRLAALRMPAPREIPVWEARRLLSNRVIEFLAAREESVQPVHAVYAAAKLHADAAAVFLLASRAYDGGGFAARLGALLRIAPGGFPVERIEAWTRWRLDPCWGTVPESASVEDASSSGDLAADCAGTVGGILRAVSGSESPDQFLRGPTARGRGWARSWKRWLGGAPERLRGLHPRELSRTPRVVLWEAALEWLLGREERSAGLMRRLMGRGEASGPSIVRSLITCAREMEQAGIE